MGDRKFYVTENRVVNAAVVGDVEYIPVGGKSNALWADGEPLKESAFTLPFVNPSVRTITLHGAEADRAWANFKNVAGADKLVKKPSQSEPARNDQDMTADELVLGCVKSDLRKGVKHFDESGNFLETTDEILATLHRERQVTVQPMYGPRSVNHWPW